MQRLTAIVMLLALVAGCEKKPAPRPGAEVEIGGRAVSRDGDPLEGYGLRFQLDPPDLSKSAMISRVQKDGKFVGKLLPGRYRVTLLRPVKTGEQEKPGPAPQYWEINVPARGKKSFVLQAE